jgi:hypothetical protein
MKDLDFAEKIRKIREVDAIKEELGKLKDD